MTVMIPTYFGVPQSLIRNGRLKSLGGAAVKLYIALWHESERHRTRELTKTASQLRSLTGMHRNSIASAQRELVDAGLVTADRFGEKGFMYQLCDPETAKPWPGRPDVKVDYQKRPAAASGQGHRAATNRDLAGTNFPFGANARPQNLLPQEPLQREPVSASNALLWEEVGRNG